MTRGDLAALKRLKGSMDGLDLLKEHADDLIALAERRAEESWKGLSDDVADTSMCNGTEHRAGWLSDSKPCDCSPAEVAGREVT